MIGHRPRAVRASSGQLAGPALLVVLASFAVAAAPSGAEGRPLEIDPAAARPLQIYAPPALAEAFRELSIADACPRTALPELVLGDPRTLRIEIERGARADVIASDDAATIEALVAAGHVVAPQRFARGVSPRSAVYWIAPLRGAPRPVAAVAFVERVRSAPGQALLERYGFRPVSKQVSR
jgi:hypothetical protein